MTRNQHWASLVCNIATVLLVTYATITMANSLTGMLSFSGIKALRLFTVDSNLLAAISCLVMIPCNIAGIRNNEKGLPKKKDLSKESLAEDFSNALPKDLPKGVLPKGILLFKFVGTVAVTITFLTVMCFLGPLVGYGAMLADSNLWLHLVCPVLCIVSLCFFEKGKITIPQSLLGLLPVVLYGTWYFIMVILIGQENGGWTDWYGFNRGGMWPISMVVMALGTTIVCLVLRLRHRK